MTDNDIIKALECCSKSSKLGDCIDNKCTLLGEYGCSDWMDNKLLKSALDLIKRQKAEIEGLVQEKDNLIKTYKECMTEAITEFAERLCEGRVSNDPVVIAVKTELKMMKEGVNNA